METATKLSENKNNYSNVKGRYKWTNLKKIETDCNYDF